MGRLLMEGDVADESEPEVDMDGGEGAEAVGGALATSKLSPQVSVMFFLQSPHLRA